MKYKFLSIILIVIILSACAITDTYDFSELNDFKNIMSLKHNIRDVKVYRVGSDGTLYFRLHSDINIDSDKEIYCIFDKTNTFISNNNLEKLKTPNFINISIVIINKSDGVYNMFDIENYLISDENKWTWEESLSNGEYLSKDIEYSIINHNCR